MGGSVVSLQLVLTVEHGGNEIMRRPNRRWIWAELGLMEDGIELWSVQRLRLEAHSQKKDVRPAKESFFFCLFFFELT